MSTAELKPHPRSLPRLHHRLSNPAVYIRRNKAISCGSNNTGAGFPVLPHPSRAVVPSGLLRTSMPTSVKPGLSRCTGVFLRGHTSLLRQKDCEDWGGGCPPLPGPPLFPKHTAAI